MKEISDLSWYFPDFREGQLPEREYLWNVLYILNPNETGQLIKDAREKRSVSSSCTIRKFSRNCPRFASKAEGTQTSKEYVVSKIINCIILI